MNPEGMIISLIVIIGFEVKITFLLYYLLSARYTCVRRIFSQLNMRRALADKSIFFLRGHEGKIEDTKISQDPSSFARRCVRKSELSFLPLSLK